MNIVSVENLTKHYEEKQLFTQLSFGIEEGERIGLIGINGSGKSTLLQIVAGHLQPDEGSVTYRSGLTVEYLAQSPAFDPRLNVLQTVYQGESLPIRILRAYEQALTELQMAPGAALLQARMTNLQAEMERNGLWSLEARAKAILTRLGIEEFTQPVGELSGGQRKRVALARALIQPADLLILDEPTNHIDNDTVAWLEEYLSKFTGALLLVTHDRYFLDRVVTRTVELDGGKLYTYAGNYGDFLEQKANREALASAREEKRQNLLRRELAWLRRGAMARTTKQKARIQRVEAIQADRPDAKGDSLDIAIGTHRLGKRIIELKEITKSFGGRTLLRDFSYNMLQADRIGIIGPNGSGKSTLLNLIAGRVAPDAGEVITGQTVRLAYYDQENGAMDPEMRVIDYLRAVAEVVRTADGGTISASQMLSRFLFPVPVQYTPIGKLSGGERRRLYLLRTLMSEPNVLLLDEPTNDLDIQTLTILEDYLDSFPGVVVTVSHDRYFLDRIAEHLFAFEGAGRIRRYVGGYSDYLAARSLVDATAEPAQAGSGAVGSGVAGAAGGSEVAGAAPPPKERTLKFTFKEQREFDSIEGEIAELEGKAAALEQAITAAATDYARLQQLTHEQAEVDAALSRKLDRWAELTELAEAIERQKLERQR